MKPVKQNPDEYFMQLALNLAKRAEGKTSPNPLVGAVIVKNGKILGRGFHKKAGLPHAEIEAIKEAKHRLDGATLYVNLEPCSHFGRTPPCTEAIIRAGIRRVFVGMLDPNPLNNGKGIKRLRDSGIKIKIGILEEEARRLNEVFIKYITKQMPFVTVKIAESLDGKIATKTGESKWISSEASRTFVDRLRAKVDAILVGINTILKDDPLLNSKFIIQNSKLFYKVIVDSRLRTSIDAKIFSKDSVGKVILATTRYVPRSKINLFSKKAEVFVCKDKNKRVDLKDLMRRLAKRQISHVLVEGGGEIIASALEEKIVDKIFIFIANKIIGGKHTLTSVEGKGIGKLSQAIKLKDFRLRRIGADILIMGYPIYSSQQSLVR